MNSDGNVSVLVCVICALVMMATIFASELGQAQIIKINVQNAADAAALSAAYELSIYEHQKACTSAALSADKNGVVLISCKATTKDVYVEVSDQRRKIFSEAKAEVD